MSEIINEGAKFISGVGGMLGGATGYDKFSPDQYQIKEASFYADPQEQALTNAILARASGAGGPSVAEQQMKAGLEQQGSQAMGMAAAQRGMSPALAARQAQQAAAQAGAQTNQQAATLRAQEQLAAEQLGMQSLQGQRQARMGLENLRTNQSLGLQNLQGQAFEGAAGRSAGTIKSLGQGLMMMSEGGMVPGYASGGVVDPTLDSFAAAVGQQVGQMMSKGILDKKGGTLEEDMSKYSSLFNKGAGESFTAPTGMSGPQVMMPSASKGMTVPGKAEKPGDAQENDTVPAMLSPGEIVIPRTIAKKSPEEIAQFVMALRGGF